MDKVAFERFGKFCLVGLTGVIISMASLWFFTEVLNFFYIISGIIASGLSISNNFWWNEVWTFRDKKSISRGNIFIRWFKFSVSRAAIAIIGLGILTFLTEVVRIYYLLSSIISIGFITVVNYSISSRWVWGTRHLTKPMPLLDPSQSIAWDQHCSGKKLRILVFNWRDLRNRKAGGAEVRLHEIFSRIARMGYECVLITSRHKGLAREEVIDGLLVKRLGPEYAFPLLAPFYYWYSLLKGANYDLVVEDISKIPLFTPIWSKKPLIGIFHQFHGPILFQELPLPLALLAEFAERLLGPVYKNTPLIVVSESTKEELIKRTFGVRKAPLKVILGAPKLILSPTPVPKTLYPSVLYLGRLARYKNLDHLLAAMKIVIAKFPEARLLIAGKGDSLRLKRLAFSLGIEQSVMFYGEVSEEEKATLLRSAWVFAIPSLKEGFGLSVLEAALSGTPAVGYEVSGLRDSIKSGETGILVPYGDIKGLAKAIISILGDEILRETLSKNAALWARQFDWDLSAAQTLDFLLTAYKRKHHGSLPS